MTGTVVLAVVGIFVCIRLSGFFSSSEMVYSACNRLRLENLRDDGDPRAAAAVRVTDRFDDTLSAILIGNNLVNIASSSLGSVLVMLLTGTDRWTWAATLVITLLVIVFGETIPKIAAKKQPNTLALRYAYPVRALTVVLGPFVRLTVWLISLITRNMKKDEADPEEAVETLSSLIETAENEDVLDEDQSELVQAAIDFSDISAYEVMTARVDMDAIDAEDSPEEIRRVIEESTHSRLPVYKDSVDNIIGVLYLNRYLKALSEEGAVTDLTPLLLKPVYVYKTMKLPVVLNRLRKAKQHLAVVTDEYGGTLGVVSMEDVLEEIVGEIWDETDTVEHEVEDCGDGGYEVDGDMPISDFLELVGIGEEEFEGESETVGGWTMEQLEKFPEPGDSFRYRDLEVTVLGVDGLRVERVRVTPAKENVPEETAAE